MTEAGQGSTPPSVLVVDDEPDIRMLARVFLERDGFTVIGEAEDGPEALERFQELDPPETPTVVLLDNRMPGLTGLEVAEQMLAQHPTQVIVLFSAHLDSAVREKARAIGIAACASKIETHRVPEILRTVLP
jgi:two-component system, chemotaxis family, chemotaxis protein CheY